MFQVTITNNSKGENRWPLTVNGAEIKKSTRLLNGQKVHILDEEYLWKFDNIMNSHRRPEETPLQLQTTPSRTTETATTEENAYSEPNLRVSVFRIRSCNIFSISQASVRFNVYASECFLLLS